MDILESRKCKVLKDLTSQPSGPAKVPQYWILDMAMSGTYITLEDGQQLVDGWKTRALTDRTFDASNLVIVSGPRSASGSVYGPFFVRKLSRYLLHS